MVVASGQTVTCSAFNGPVPVDPQSEQDALSPVMDGFGSGLTVTVTDVAAEQPLASVTVTEYVVVVDGLTDTDAVFCPVLQV